MSLVSALPWHSHSDCRQRGTFVDDSTHRCARVTIPYAAIWWVPFHSFSCIIDALLLSVCLEPSSIYRNSTLPLTRHIRLLIIAEALYTLLIFSLLFSKEDPQECFLVWLHSFSLAGNDQSFQLAKAESFCFSVSLPPDSRSPTTTQSRQNPTHPLIRPLTMQASLYNCCLFLGSPVPPITPLTPGELSPWETEDKGPLLSAKSE